MIGLVFDFFTLMVGGAMARYLSPLWYVMDSCPMIIAPPNGSGTKLQEDSQQ